MLTRQKKILSLLYYADRPLALTSFVKLSFLLRHETTVGENPGFYDFVPYNFGPFSFALYKELDFLKREGLLSSSIRLSIAPNIRLAVKDIIDSLEQSVLQDSFSIVRKYGGIPQHELLKYVYRRFPWYATKTKRPDLLPLPASLPVTVPRAVYTMGYQNKSVDSFFNELLKSGIKAIFDVRSNPVSRKYGFARRSMSNIAAKLGLEYRHFPEVGIPAGLRTGLSDYASYQGLFDHYEREILLENREYILLLGNLMKAKPSVLVCMEQDPRYCHRGRLAASISKLSGLEIKHLQ